MASATERRLLVVFALAVSFCAAAAVLSQQGWPGSAPDGRPPLIVPDARCDVWRVDLQAGENYFALPLVPFEFTWDGLFGAVADVVEEAALFDPELHRWRRWRPEEHAFDDAAPGEGLVFRVLARRPAVVWFQGRRFRGRLAEACPLEERLRAPLGGWSFVGASWDATEGTSLPGGANPMAHYLAAQNIVPGTDKVLRWSRGRWEPAAASDLGAVKRGEVVAVARLADQAKDPYASTGPQGFGSSLGYLASLSDQALTSYLHTAGFGFQSSLGSGASTNSRVDISAHTYEEVGGLPVRGSCTLTLPAVYRDFTDLPQRVVGEVAYTTSEKPDIRFVRIKGITTIMVDPRSQNPRRLTDVADLMVLGDGTVFARGKLRDEAASKGPLGGTTQVDVDVQLVLNPEWPSIDPATPTAQATATLPALELEVPLGTNKMACLRWYKEAKDALNPTAPVKRLDGWRVYLYNDYEKRLTIEQDGAPSGLKDGVRAALELFHDPASNQDRPRWRVPDVKRAQSGFSFQWIVPQDEATLYAYDTGLLTFQLNDAWNCHLDGDRVDYELVSAGTKAGTETATFALHLCYMLALSGSGTTAGVTAEGAVLVEGRNIALGTDFRFDRIMGGIEARFKVEHSLNKGAGFAPSRDYRTVRDMWAKGFGKGFGEGLGEGAKTGVETFLGDLEGSLKVSGCLEMSSPQALNGKVTALGSVELEVKPAAKSSHGAAQTTTSSTVQVLDWLNTQSGWTLTVRAQVGFEAFKAPEGSELATRGKSESQLKNLGGMFTFAASSQTLQPTFSVGLQLYTTVQLPDGWQLEQEQGSVDASLTFLIETWNPARAGYNNLNKGDRWRTHVRVEAAVSSDFTVRFAGADKAPKLQFGSEVAPEPEWGMRLDLLRLWFDTAWNWGGPADFAVEVGAMGSGHVVLKGEPLALFLSGKVVYEKKAGEKFDFKKAFDGTEFLAVVDVGVALPVVQDYLALDKFFLAFRQGEVSLGASILFRARKDLEWARASLLPVFSLQQNQAGKTRLNWRVTLAVDDFRIPMAPEGLQDGVSLDVRSAVLTVGNTVDGPWSVSLGADLELPKIPDFGFFHDTGIKLGLFVNFASQKGATAKDKTVSQLDVSAYLREAPYVGSETLGLQLKELSGAIAMEWGTGRPALFPVKSLSLSGTLDVNLHAFKFWDVNSKAKPKPVRGTFSFEKRFPTPDEAKNSTQRTWSLGMELDPSGFATWQFLPGATLEEGGGFAIEQLALRYAPHESVPGTTTATGTLNKAANKTDDFFAGMDLSGTASVYLPKPWRDTFGSIAGSGFGVSLPAKTTATVRTVGGLKGPLEIGAKFSQPVGLQIGQLAQLGITSFYFRKASPWSMKADAELRTGDGFKDVVKGTLGRAEDGGFLFRPDLTANPLKLKFGDFTFSLKDFLLSFAPKSGDRPMTFAIAGTCEGSIAGAGADGNQGLFTGTLSLSVAGDGSMTVALEVATGGSSFGGAFALPKASARIALSVQRATAADGTKKWTVAVSVGAKFTIPKEFPLLGGTEVCGTVSGDTNGDFLFTVTADPMPRIPLPLMYQGTWIGAIGLTQLTFGRQGGDWMIAATGGMVLYSPFTQNFGAPKTDASTWKVPDLPEYEEIQLPQITLGFLGGDLFIQFPAVGSKGLGLTLNLGDLGECFLGLDYLRLSIKGVAASGGFRYAHPTLEFLKFGVTFAVGFDVVTQAANFAVNFDPPFTVISPPYLYTIEKLGMRQILSGFYGWEATMGCGLPNPICGFFMTIKDLFYFDPGMIPPVGFPLFDYAGCKVTVLGFSGNAAIALPRPRFPDPMTLVQLLMKIIGAFSGGGDNPKTWDDLDTWLFDNREKLQQVLKGPGVGDLYLLLPHMLHDALPELQVVEDVVWPLPKLTMKVLRLPLLDKMYFATDAMEVLGLGWTKCLVRSLQMLYNLIQVVKGEMNKVISVIPEEKRHGGFNFAVPGFASAKFTYDIVADAEEFATERVAAAPPFAQFHRMATWVERTYPTLASISSRGRKPVTTGFAFKDGEGQPLSGLVKDTFVDLRPLMTEAVALHEALGTGAAFDEAQAFRRHMEYVHRNHGARFEPSSTDGDPELRAKLTAKRSSSMILYGTSAPVTLADPRTRTVYEKARTFPFNATWRARRTRAGAEPGPDDAEDDLVDLAVATRVAERDGKLVLAFDVVGREAKSGAVLFRGEVPDQAIYDLDAGRPAGAVALAGWRISHALDDQGLGRAEFTDYGTMKVTAPLTLVTAQYPGAKLGRLREIADFVDKLPVFDADSSSFLLANYFWYSLHHGGLPLEGRRLQGNAILTDLPRASGQGQPMGVRLTLEDVRYGDEETGPGQRLRMSSDIRAFYEKDGRLIAQPFQLTITGDPSAPSAQQDVRNLVVLDGSDDVTPLFESRLALLKAGTKTLFQIYEQLGLNWDFQQLSLRRASVSVQDDDLLTTVRPDFVEVTNLVSGATILSFGKGDANQLARLRSFGPYGDEARYPLPGASFLVECRGFADATSVSIDGPAAMLDLFTKELLLREVDLQQPAGLLQARLPDGTLRADHVEARSDGAWEGGLRVPGAKLPDDVMRFVRQSGGVLAYATTEPGRPIQFRRRFNGEVELLVERAPGEWTPAKLTYTPEGRVAPAVRYPTGRVLPGGFFVDGALDLGQAQSLGGNLAFNGNLKTDGDFHFEGGCRIFVLGKSLASAHFIIDRRDGVYIYGDFDTGIARAFIEGRISKNDFSLVGELDARVGSLLGIKAAVTINPYLFYISGDVMVAGRKIFHGLIRVNGSTFQFEWSLSNGIFGVSANISFTSVREGDKVKDFKIEVSASIFVDLGWPFGRLSARFALTIDKEGWLKVTLGPLWIGFNLPQCKVAWGFK